MCKRNKIGSLEKSEVPEQATLIWGPVWDIISFMDQLLLFSVSSRQEKK